jgi:glyoxylase-like metal-dependent hydrolase (beta-lactamase superfamily II)
MSVNDGKIPLTVEWAFPDFDAENSPIRNIKGDSYFEHVEETMLGTPGYVTSNDLKIGGILIVSDDNVMLFDTGMGEVNPIMPLGSDYNLYQQLSDIGCTDIDIVITSHMHFDHTGWNIRYANTNANDNKDGDDNDSDKELLILPTWDQPTVYYVQNDEFYYWTELQIEDESTTDMAIVATKKTISTHVESLVESGQIALRFGDYFVSSNVQVRRCIGHTPGHQCIVLYDENMKALVLFAGDASHTPYQVSDPDLNTAFDTLPDNARQTRNLLVREAFENDILFAPIHYPGVGRIVECDDDICHAKNGLTWIQMSDSDLRQWSKRVREEGKNDLR